MPLRRLHPPRLLHFDTGPAKRADVQKTACNTIFIAERSIGYNNGYGRRPANQYYEKIAA